MTCQGRFVSSNRWATREEPVRLRLSSQTAKVRLVGHQIEKVGKDLMMRSANELGFEVMDDGGEEMPSHGVTVLYAYV
jgi:hypothetical protein